MLMNIRMFFTVFLVMFLLVGCSGGGGAVGVSSDTTAPVITLMGDNPQFIEQGTSYIELGTKQLRILLVVLFE